MFTEIEPKNHDKKLNYRAFHCQEDFHYQEVIINEHSQTIHCTIYESLAKINTLFSTLKNCMQIMTFVNRN